MVLLPRLCVATRLKNARAKKFIIVPLIVVACEIAYVGNLDPLKALLKLKKLF